MQQPVQNLDSKIKELWPKNGPSSQEVEKYIKKYSKEKIVIKCGGKVLLDQSLLRNLIEDVVILKKLGLTPILIHGGGLGIKKKLLCCLGALYGMWIISWELLWKRNEILHGIHYCIDICSIIDLRYS